MYTRILSAWPLALRDTARDRREGGRELDLDGGVNEEEEKFWCRHVYYDSFTGITTVQTCAALPAAACAHLRTLALHERWTDTIESKQVKIGPNR